MAKYRMCRGREGNESQRESTREQKKVRWKGHRINAMPSSTRRRAGLYTYGVLAVKVRVCTRVTVVGENEWMSVSSSRRTHRTIGRTGGSSKMRECTTATWRQLCWLTVVG